MVQQLKESLQDFDFHLGGGQGSSREPAGKPFEFRETGSKYWASSSDGFGASSYGEFDRSQGWADNPEDSRGQGPTFRDGWVDLKDM